MDFTVSLDSGEQLEFFPSITQELLHYPSLPVVYRASGEWGTVIFQSLQTEGFTIWHFRYLIKEDTCLHIRAAIATSVLHIALKNSFDVDAPGWERTRLKEEQFNFSYFPAIDIKLQLPPGEYAGFGINYSTNDLQQLIPHFAGMRPFLQQAEAGTPCRLCPGHLYASPQMLATVKNILDLKYTDGLGRLYIEHEAWALLMLAIHLVGEERDRPFVITATDTVRMESVRDWLLSLQDDPGSLPAIARRFAINEFRLKRDFKAVFGTTVFDYLLQIRMQRAEQLLKDSELSIAEIAYNVGYSSGAHFSDAFRKRFGYPPNYLRRDRHPRS